MLFHDKIGMLIVKHESYQEWWRDRPDDTTATYREARCQFLGDEINL